MARSDATRVPKSSAYRGVTLFRPTGKWRAQISAGGKTTSLGDHNTEDQAARAFDKAMINKDGWNAKTNFPLEQYQLEIDNLHAMSNDEMVALLRSKARRPAKGDTEFHGVHLMREIGSWHAQIDFQGIEKLHLGLFTSEQKAARAYDRAALYKAIKEKTKVTVNFDVSEYEDEIGFIASLSEGQLIAELSRGSNRSWKSAASAKGALRAADLVEELPSRPPSPVTPQMSNENETSSQRGPQQKPKGGEDLKAESKAPALTVLSGRVFKPSRIGRGNRRCILQPRRAPLQ